MTTGTAEALHELTVIEQHTTEMRCPVCVITLSLDDDRPRIGTVTWDVHEHPHARIGVAVRFECPNGHCSDDDPALLKAFRRRRF